MSSGSSDSTSQVYGQSPSLQGPPAPGGSWNPSNNVPADNGGALSHFGDSLIHGQGQRTEQQQLMSAIQGNQLKQMDPSDPNYAQVQANYQANMHPDNGGYLGSLMRAVTGTGQTTGEQALGQGLQMGMALYRQNMMRQALQNSNANMQGAGNVMAANQKAALGGGMFK